MVRAVNVAGSLVAGLLAFALVAVGITASLESRIEFSLLVGVPVGLYAGVTAVFATFAALTTRDRTDSPSVSRRALWAAYAAALDVVVVAVLGLLVFFLVDAGVGIGVLLVGVPVTLLASAVGGYLLAGSGGRAGSGSRDAPR